MNIPRISPLLYDLIDRVQEGPPGIDLYAWETLAAAHRALSARVEEDDAAMAKIIQFATADYELNPDDIRWCLEYISSHLVNKFQGALAEYLATRELGAWLSERVATASLGADVCIVPGDSIREHRQAGKGQQWLRGADGLLIVDKGEANDEEPRPLAVAGVIEIKSPPR